MSQELNVLLTSKLIITLEFENGYSNIQNYDEAIQIVTAQQQKVLRLHTSWKDIAQGVSSERYKVFKYNETPLFRFVVGIPRRRRMA